MNGEKKNFYILLWSREDITIDNESLKLIIESEAPGTKIQIMNLGHLQDMRIKKLKSFLEHYSERSVLIISSSEEAEDMDFWKLGYIMGKVSVPERIIGFVKGDQTSCFQELSDLLSTCESETDIKEEIKGLMEDMGIETVFDVEAWGAGKRSAGEGI
jgi:hypothetical protein